MDRVTAGFLSGLGGVIAQAVVHYTLAHLNLTDLVWRRFASVFVKWIEYSGNGNEIPPLIMALTHGPVLGEPVARVLRWVNALYPTSARA